MRRWSASTWNATSFMANGTTSSNQASKLVDTFIYLRCLTVGRSKRIDTIKEVFDQRRKRLSKVPKFRDLIVANSMAKDMLTLAVVGVREGRAARFRHTQGILRWPKKRTLSLLAWVGWEHRTIRRVVRGRLPLENPLRVVDLINNCS